MTSGDKMRDLRVAILNAIGDECDHLDCTTLRRATDAVMETLPCWTPIKDIPNEWMDGRRLHAYAPPYGSGSAHYDLGWHLHFCINPDAKPTHVQELLPAPSSNFAPNTQEKEG